MGYRCRIPQVKPLLNQKQRQKRLTWATEKQHWTVAQWSKVTVSASPTHTSYHLKSQSSSPQSSDCEDTDKRKTHNFLERKRRNDLRSRFLALRDEIPGLVDCPKTPKVVILTKATEYLRSLHISDKQKAQEKKQLKSRQQQLLRRLAELKRT
ncbi:Protein L-Myc-1b [Anabarilius grahami]|uniref:Protein L-Myc-1b n=1 Tax=Anabarilius grahami TaxID=495550 RepID=A0A3N0XZ63_ANAGA|nr:Protein L-Myc-1b [Anabarilius grahami]